MKIHNLLSKLNKNRNVTYGTSSPRNINEHYNSGNVVMVLLDDYMILKNRGEILEMLSNRSAADALHYYTCHRTFEWWRAALDEAEKSGNKYISLAEMFTKIQEENENRIS